MFFDGDNIYFEYNNVNYDRNTTLQNEEEGFNKGNMFKNLYSKYKNHVYKLKVNTKKDDLLLKIQMYTFALKDLGLYLDVHPEDRDVFNKFIDIKRKLQTVKEKYEKEYTPLCLESNNDNNYDYINGPWPWDKGEK